MVLVEREFLFAQFEIIFILIFERVFQKIKKCNCIINDWCRRDTVTDLQVASITASVTDVSLL